MEYLDQNQRDTILQAFDEFAGDHGYWPSVPIFSLRDTRTWILREISQIKAGARVLDLGSGRGSPWGGVLTSTGGSWSGVDLHESTEDGYRRGSHDSIPFGDNIFDVVATFDVVEHFENPDLMFREIHRVLKPEGVWFGSCAFWQKEHHSFVHFTHRGLRAFLERNGFEVVTIEPTPATGIHLVFQRYWGGSGRIDKSSPRARVQTFALGAATAPLLYFVSLAEGLRRFLGLDKDPFAYCAGLNFRAIAKTP